ncbi:MAG: alpha/beta fold hydrolase [Oscillospiraceae bacterium]|nr:alpha/beta fold hydrolase [Oscillospiraceae bacterium]MBQ7130742.1 alpha/beta fold hydrolase [Oscillospiraceae bacterium]
MIFEKKVIGIYRSQFLSRCDDKGLAHYFSHADFPGLRQQPFDFRSSLGHTMKGWFYCYDEIIPGRVVVFDHGFGGGHRSYMKEIELLARHGYLVYTYDHTGCMESGGDSPRGLSQSLRDLNDAINALQATQGFRNLDISVMGHSWGAFACMNIAALHPEISHIVALSGFVSVEEMVGQFFSGILRGYRKPVLKIEQENNPDFVKYNAVKTLSETAAQVLLIYSANDKLVIREIHHGLLTKGLKDKKNVRILLEENKGHNPNYTADAVAYLAEYTADMTRRLKDKQLSTEEEKAAFRAKWDWDRMTEQDEKVWAEIFKTLDA